MGRRNMSEAEAPENRHKLHATEDGGRLELWSVRGETNGKRYYGHCVPAGLWTGVPRPLHDIRNWHDSLLASFYKRQAGLQGSEYTLNNQPEIKRRAHYQRFWLTVLWLPRFTAGWRVLMRSAS